jgi:hypothetical protein
MSDNGRRVGSPVPSQNVGNDSASGSVRGRNRAASTTKSVLSVRSNGTARNSAILPAGNRRINVAPRMSFRHPIPLVPWACLCCLYLALDDYRSSLCPVPLCHTRMPGGPSKPSTSDVLAAAPSSWRLFPGMNLAHNSPVLR